MKKFHIESKEFIPEIRFDPDTSILEIAGDSYHEYTYEFFSPIFKWLEAFLTVPDRHITLNFRMTYFNTASSKCFYDIIEMVKDYQVSGKGSATINWYYKKNDDDMLEMGKDYIHDAGWDINLIAY